MSMSVEKIAEKWHGTNRVGRDGEIIPYELVYWDALGKRMAIPGHYRIPKGRAEDYIRYFMKSFEAGGVNEKISKSLGYIPYPSRVELMYHGDLVWTWKAPMFMVW